MVWKVVACLVFLHAAGKQRCSCLQTGSILGEVADLYLAPGVCVDPSQLFTDGGTSAILLLQYLKGAAEMPTLCFTSGSPSVFRLE